ncbi:TPA: tail fiber assembly protein [Providencia alcalifaciens]
MKMNYYRDKNTSAVFAYDDAQLEQVSRITELETLLTEKEPLFVETGHNLQLAMQELNEAKAQLDTAITNSVTDDEEMERENLDEIKKKTQIFDDKAEKFEKSHAEFENIKSEYQPLKDEYDAILPVFFEIREHLRVIKKMTDKDVEAYTNPPVSKEQHIAEAEQKKQMLLSEATEAIAPLQDAVDLDIATDEEIALLKEWKKYRVLLNRVDTSTAPDIDWPEKP